QRVGVDRPLELALTRAEAPVRLGDRLEGDVQVGVVYEDGEKTDNQNAEDPPAPSVNRLRVHGAFRKLTKSGPAGAGRSRAPRWFLSSVAGRWPRGGRAIDTEQERIDIHSRVASDFF